MLTQLLAFGTRLLFLFLVFGAIVAILANFLPLLPQPMVDSLVTLILGINRIGLFVPIDTIKQVLIAAASLAAVLFVWDAIDWFLRRTRQ